MPKPLRLPDVPRARRLHSSEAACSPAAMACGLPTLPSVLPVEINVTSAPSERAGSEEKLTSGRSSEPDTMRETSWL